MKSIRLLLIGLLSLSFASCGNEDDFSVEEKKSLESKGEINFSIGFDNQTKVSTGTDFKSKFEDGDEIGVFIIKSGESLKSSGNYEDNRKLTYNAGEWTLDGDKIYSPVDGSTLTFYAYYPYVSGADPVNMIFTVDNNQKDESIYNDSDLILAKAENQMKTTVNLQFSHALSLVQVEIVKGANMVAFDNSLTVILRNCSSSANVNLVNSSATSVVSATQDIAMLRVEKETSASTYTYRALVPAQTIGVGKEIFSFIQETTGKEINFNYSTETATTLTGGKVSKWKITLTGDPLPEHNYSVGDVYPFTGTPQGIVFEVYNGGKNGKVVSLTEKQNRWGTSPKDESTDGVALIRDIDDGKSATHSLINVRKSASNFSTDYAVFHWLYSEMNESDVNGQWYIPSKNELRSLYAAISGIAYADIETSWIDGGAMPNLNSTAAIAARTEFNTKLTNAGGVILNLTGQYWASTEIDNQKVWSVHFQTGILQNSKFKYDTWGRARAIMQF